MSVLNFQEELKSFDIPYIIKNYEEYSKNISIGSGVKLIKLANHFYYTGAPIFPDDIYDKIEGILKTRSPNNKVWKEIRAPFEVSEEKVELPYWMGSMDKVKPGKNEIDKWSSKYPGPYIISEKLDGMSCLLIIKNLKDQSKEIKMYSRGNGKIGYDVSHLLNYLNLPEIKFDDSLKKMGITDELTLRGELIISQKTFKNKYEKTKTDARSMVAGLMNAKHPDPNEIKDLDLVIYEIIIPSAIKPSIQFLIAKKLGFKTAKTEQYDQDTIDDDVMIGLLTKMKLNSSYDIDGVILTQDKSRPRNTSENPEYSRAFKMSSDDQRATATVEEILWEVSKWGKLIPRIKVKPVNIGNITIQKATAFNAKYIQDNKLGPDAKVQLIRSGDVIPYIEKVISESPSGASMPNMKYKWHPGGYDIYVDQSESTGQDDLQIKQLTYFMTTLDVEGINQSTIKRLYDNGYKTLSQIFKMTKDDFLKLPNTKEKLATKHYEAIQEILNKTHPLESLMASSSLFGLGFGTRKSKAILEVYPDILTKSITIDDIIEINGFESKTAKLFMDGLPKFKSWLNTHNLKYKLPSSSSDGTSSNNKLKNQSIVMTGFRDKDLETLIEKEGGTNSTSISSKTTILIAKDPNGGGSKIDKATSLNIPVLDVAQFKKKFNL
jgi:NAD-dependent DNA ligase